MRSTLACQTPVRFPIVWLLAILSLSIGACNPAPTSRVDRDVLEVRSRGALDAFTRADPSLRPLLDRAAGYAVFPGVAKGAAGVGAAYGRGEVFEGGKIIGYCDLRQGTVGLQLGGQEYMELIVFETGVALERFKSGAFTFSGNASAVAVSAGAAATAPFQNGVAVFTATKGGLMFEASVGGQRFTYRRR